MDSTTVNGAKVLFKDNCGREHGVDKPWKCSVAGFEVVARYGKQSHAGTGVWLLPCVAPCTGLGDAIRFSSLARTVY